MRTALLSLLLLGCGPTEPDRRPPTGTGSPTQSDGKMTVRCSEQAENRLRYDCTVTTTTPGPVEVRWTAVQDGTVRSLVTETTGTEHALTITALKPGWEYEVLFTGPDGSRTRHIDIGPVPSFVQSEVVVTGTGSTPILAEIPCMSQRALGIIDTDGVFLWYQMYGSGGTGPVEGGYQFTPQGTVLAAYGDVITEITLAGEELLRLERGVDFPDAPLHHDVHRGDNGLTYALFAEEVQEADGDYVLDGFFVFDGPDLVATWHLADHITASGGQGGFGFWAQHFPGATDYSHANAIHVTADGTAYLSLRWLSTAMKIDADPSSPTFGEIDWQLVGEATSPLASDFALTSSIGAAPDFIGQHHVNPRPDGRFGLFDNRKVGSSRAVVIDLDPTSWTADIQESWDIGWICSAQGANYPLPNGNALATCATSGWVFEFAPGQPDPVWTLELSCGYFTMLPRGIPAPI